MTGEPLYWIYELNSFEPYVRSLTKHSRQFLADLEHNVAACQVRVTPPVNKTLLVQNRSRKSPVRNWIRRTLRFAGQRVVYEVL